MYRIYADITKRAAENFLALAASGYYNGTLFHRNMRGFMVQGGDPTGTGKGGESIWGGMIDDEFSSLLKHGMYVLTFLNYIIYRKVGLFAVFSKKIYI